MKCLQQDLEGDHELLTDLVTHDISCAHETVERSCTAASDIPMLLKQEERENGINVFIANTLSKCAWLISPKHVLLVLLMTWVLLETTMCVRISLEVVNGLILEALARDECRNDCFNLQK